VGSDGFVVIPAPREVKMLAGKGLMYNDLKGVYLADAGDKGVWSRKYKEKLSAAQKEIKRYEKTSTILKTLGKKAHRKLNNFEQAWSILKPVYSKTRFIANPDSYLMDGDKTHIANRRPDLA